MRDKKRIPKICKAIENLWKKHSDQRLGQLLSNYVFGQTDIFYQEDDITEERLER